MPCISYALSFLKHLSYTLLDCCSMHHWLLRMVGNLPSGVTEMPFILLQCWRASYYFVLLQKQPSGKQRNQKL